MLFHMSQPSPDLELMREEARLWTELHRLVEPLPKDKVGEPGYFTDRPRRAAL
jgi:hypothetical protein